MSLDAQIDLMVTNPDSADVPWSEIDLVIRPQQPATLRVLEWLESAGRELKAIKTKTGENYVVLMPTTIQSIADVLRDQGYDDGAPNDGCART